MRCLSCSSLASFKNRLLQPVTVQLKSVEQGPELIIESEHENHIIPPSTMYALPLLSRSAALGVEGSSRGLSPAKISLLDHVLKVSPVCNAFWAEANGPLNLLGN